MTTDTQTISYKPALVDLVDVVQGDTFSFKVVLTDAAGDPIDITGDTADMEIKRLDGSLVLALSVGDGITLSDPGNGEMTIAVEAADTANLEPEYTYSYDVQWTSGTTIRTVAAGKIKIMKQITD